MAVDACRNLSLLPGKGPLGIFMGSVAVTFDDGSGGSNQLYCCAVRESSNPQVPPCVQSL